MVVTPSGHCFYSCASYMYMYVSYHWLGDKDMKSIFAVVNEKCVI